MNLLIDTQTTMCQASVPPKPVFEFGTKNHKLDENGEPLFTIEVVAFFADTGAEVLPVKFAGTPPVGIRIGTPLRITNLIASTWVMKDGAHGVSFRASKVEVIANSAPVKAGA